jgi:hypothetical protein
MQSVYNYIKQHAFVFVSYLDILFFSEIINLMFFLTLIFGKYISIMTGIVLSLLLCLQIIGLFFKKNISRIAQLIVMDLHLAYSIPFLVFFAVYFRESRTVDVIFVCIRTMISCFEILFIFILSNYKENTEEISLILPR